MQLSTVGTVPFLDELGPVVLVNDVGRWSSEFLIIRRQLRVVEISDTGIIEHVGSTAVPGLVAKDVIDVQIRVPAIESDAVVARISALGFRHRPEKWNNLELTRAGPFPKLVFAPPVGARRSNVHVRPNDSPGARDTLLFRDYLRANEDVRISWDLFKRSLVEQNRDIDLASYGQAKQLPWNLLMLKADSWALANGWLMQPMMPWSRLM